jgi:hypothetical protein
MAVVMNIRKDSKKYTIEEFSKIEVKVKAVQPILYFIDFVGKARVEYSKK